MVTTVSENKGDSLQDSANCQRDEEADLFDDQMPDTEQERDQDESQNNCDASSVSQSESEAEPAPIITDATFQVR